MTISRLTLGVYPVGKRTDKFVEFRNSSLSTFETTPAMARTLSTWHAYYIPQRGLRFFFTTKTELPHPGVLSSAYCTGLQQSLRGPFSRRVLNKEQVHDQKVFMIYSGADTVAIFFPSFTLGFSYRMYRRFRNVFC